MIKVEKLPNNCFKISYEVYEGQKVFLKAFIFESLLPNWEKQKPKEEKMLTFKDGVLFIYPEKEVFNYICLYLTGAADYDSSFVYKRERDGSFSLYEKPKIVPEQL